MNEGRDISYRYYLHVVQSLSRIQVFETPWTAACQVSLSLTISPSLPKFMSIASVMPSSHLILWHPLLLLPSIVPSIRDFSNKSAVHIRGPKSWNFSFSISPSKECSGLTSFKVDGFDLLAVYWTGTFVCLHLMGVESGLRLIASLGVTPMMAELRYEPIF